jgi:hypothetical protein
LRRWGCRRSRRDPIRAVEFSPAGQMSRCQRARPAHADTCGAVHSKSVSAYLRYFGSWLASHLYSKCAPVRTLLTRADRKHTIQSFPRLRTLRYHRPFEPFAKSVAPSLLACDVAVGVMTSVEVRARSNVMEFGFEIREVLTHLNRGFKDATFGDLLGPVKHGLLDRDLNERAAYQAPRSARW